MKIHALVKRASVSVALCQRGIQAVACMVMLVGLFVLLMGWHIRLSERVAKINASLVPAAPFTKRPDLLQMPFNATAMPPTWQSAATVKAPLTSAVAPVALRITMVLPHPEQDDEIAFKRYFMQRGIAVDYNTIVFSDDTREHAALIARVRATRPDLIYTWGTASTMAIAGRFDCKDKADHADDADCRAKNKVEKVEKGDAAIRDIPIVFAEVTDPVGAGLLPTLDAPDRNMTGVPHIAPLAMQLALLSAYRPFSHIGFIENPQEPNSANLLTRLRTQAALRGWKVISVSLPKDNVKPHRGMVGDMSGVADMADSGGTGTAVQQAVVSLKAQGAQVLYVGTSTLLAFTYRDALTQAALDADLPTFCSTESILRESKCLYGIYSNGNNVGAYAAFKAQQILIDGIAAGHIPATPLKRFSILINLPVAARLHLYPPMVLLPLAQLVPDMPAGPEGPAVSAVPTVLDDPVDPVDPAVDAE